MEGWLENSKLETMWKEAVVAKFDVLSQYFLGVTETITNKLRLVAIRYGIWTQDLKNMKQKRFMLLLWDVTAPYVLSNVWRAVYWMRVLNAFHFPPNVTPAQTTTRNSQSVLARAKQSWKHRTVKIESVEKEVAFRAIHFVTLTAAKCSLHRVTSIFSPRFLSDCTMRSKPAHTFWTQSGIRLKIIPWSRNHI
jgi:hypothetical protein